MARFSYEHGPNEIKPILSYIEHHCDDKNSNFNQNIFSLVIRKVRSTISDFLH